VRAVVTVEGVASLSNATTERNNKA